MTMPSACNHPSSRSSLNRTPPFKVKSQSHTTLQGQVSIAQHPSRSSLNPICNHPSSRSCEVSHHPSRSSLNRAPPFKIKSQSHTTLQGQVSIAHHPSRSSLNRTPPFTPPFKVKWSSVNRAPPFLNRAPPFKVKSQSHTTLQGQVSIAHHPSSFQDSEFYLSVPRKYCFPTSFDYGPWSGMLHSHSIPSLISPQMPVLGDSQVLSILVAGIYMSFSEVRLLELASGDICFRGWFQFQQWFVMRGRG